MARLASRADAGLVPWGSARGWLLLPTTLLTLPKNAVMVRALFANCDAAANSQHGRGMPRGTIPHRCTLRILAAAAILATAVAAVPASAGAQEEQEEAPEDAFSDVTSGVHKPAIDILGAMGLFEGTLCGERMFCPGEEIKRSTMAMWLIRSLEDEAPTELDASRFADVDSGEWWAPYVERLAELEVTVGCSREPLRYCPQRSVTRGQMASFLVRAFDLESAEPAGFADIEGSTHAGSINALAAADITVGCKKDPLSYCPTRAVNRAQMATFLARALGLVEAPAASIPPSEKFLAVSAGGSHSCGLRTDETVTCWANDAERSPYSPEGKFTAVSAGLWGGCGIRADQTIVCWDDKGDRSYNEPEGRFTAVSKGGQQRCGLSVDQIIVCSNPGSYTLARFTAVSSGNGLTKCGLRAENETVKCWGTRFRAPEGRFTAVSAGGSSFCGLRADQTIACWGDYEFGQSDAPEGRFTAVSAAAMHSCGLRADQTIACWGDDRFGQSDAPEGRFTAVSARYLSSCGLRTDQTVTCWGSGSLNPSPAWSGRYISVSGNHFHGCGLHTDQTITCWGRHFGQSYTLAGRFLAVSTGQDHSCGLLADQTITCWGENERGQSSAPEGRFTAVSVGRGNSCGLLADQTITCWGSPLSAPKGRFLAVVSEADGYWCGLHSDQTVTCWGERHLSAPEGRFLALLGAEYLGGVVFCGLRDNRMITCWSDSFDQPISTPLGPFVETFVQDLRSCARRADQTVTCWDRSIEDVSNSNASTPPYSAVFAGGNHSCGLRSDLAVICWGNNAHGQADAPSGTFRTVSTGNNHSCGLRSDLAVICWGNNAHGQADAPSGTFRTVSTGNNHSCGLRSDLAVICWGNNAHGQTETPSGTFAELFTGYDHSCGLRSDFAVICWGDNTHGQTDAPAGQFRRVSTGKSHTCGLLTSNIVTCWGDNKHGQTDAPAGYFQAVPSGNNHSCGLRNDSTIACWGNNQHGQTNAPTDPDYYSCGLLADATVSCRGNNIHGRTDAPAGQFRMVSSGSNHSCGLTDNNAIICWGDNTHDQTDAPAGQFRMVSSGSNHSCGLTDNNAIICWGDNTHDQTDAPAGQFLAVFVGGDRSCGLRDDQPVTCWGTGSSVSPLSTRAAFSMVSTGNNHSCGLRHDSTVACWGDNTHGQTDPPAGTFQAVSTKYDSSCGLRDDQTVFCWGATETPEVATVFVSTLPLFAPALPPRLADCEQPFGAIEPARLADVNIDVGSISDAGMATEPVRVGWSRPCSGGYVDSYTVQWRRGYENFSKSRQETIKSADNVERYSFEIPDLGAYAVRVIAVNTGGSNSSAETMVPTTSNELRRRAEQLVVSYQDRYPWLPDVWAYMNNLKSGFKFITARSVDGRSEHLEPCPPGAAGCAGADIIAARIWRGPPETFISSDQVVALSVFDFTLNALSVVMHEMAHVHTLHNSLTRDPAAIGAGLLYLSTLGSYDVNNCNVVVPLDEFVPYAEYYADLPEYLMDADGLTLDPVTSSYWTNCPPGGHDRPPEEALEVARSVFVRQELPQWFLDTYQRANGTWNIGAIRADLATMRSHDSYSASVAQRLLRHLIPDL